VPCHENAKAFLSRFTESWLNCRASRVPVPSVRGSPGEHPGRVAVRTDRRRTRAREVRDHWSEFRSLELLTEAVFQAGVPVRVDTVVATIMRRMVSESRAVKVSPPADDPLKRWLGANEPLYNGEGVRLKFRRLKKLPER
jgi:hypothetical protein